MTDRLAELTAGTGISFEDDLVTVDLENGDDQEEVDDETKEALQQYYKESDALSRAIDKIHEKIETIESRYQVTMSDQLDESDRAIAANDIARLLDQTQKTSEAIRRRLRRIAGENKEFANEFPQKTGELRIRVNTHTGLIRRFMDAMQLFEESQEKHRLNVKHAMERHLRMMNPQATEEEIQEALQNGTTEDVVDDSPTLAQLPPEEQARLRRGLADLKNRNNDIKKLEESIIQLHQLFVDMQIMVEAQGELLNDIEYNIEETKGKTEQGLQELVQARAHQKSANRKKLCCIILFIIIVLAVVVPLIVKFVIPKLFPSTQDAIDNLPIIGNGNNQNSTDSAESDNSNNGNEGESTSGTVDEDNPPSEMRNPGLDQLSRRTVSVPDISAYPSQVAGKTNEHITKERVTGATPRVTVSLFETPQRTAKKRIRSAVRVGENGKDNKIDTEVKMKREKLKYSSVQTDEAHTGSVKTTSNSDNGSVHEYQTGPTSKVSRSEKPIGRRQSLGAKSTADGYLLDFLSKVPERVRRLNATSREKTMMVRSYEPNALGTYSPKTERTCQHEL